MLLMNMVVEDWVFLKKLDGFIWQASVFINKNNF